MKIYPAIDLINGKVVRLTKGDYDQMTSYSDDPVKTASDIEKSGSDWLHIVDLDGAKKGSGMNTNTVAAICSHTGLKVQIGGGIRTIEAARELLDSGVSRVILGTIAVQNPELLRSFVSELGSDQVVVSVDIKNGKPAVSGWLDGGEVSSQQLASNLKESGVKTLVVTDVSKDGMMQGPNIELTKQWQDYGFEVITAGGVTTVDDVKQLSTSGINGAIIGKALYEGRITVEQAIRAAETNGLANRVIACMDIKDGRVVKGTGFVDLVDSGDPLELAREYSAQNADELVLLDIAATNEARKNRAELVEQVAKAINIPFTIGGGINEINDIRQLLQAGADKVSIGSAAVTNPDFVAEAVREFGGQAIVISVDPKQEGESWKVYTNGGSKRTDVDAIEFSKQMESLGVGELLVNSLDRDGTKSGYDIDLLDAISSNVSIPVIASSGVGSVEDFAEVFEKTIVTAALGARVFHNRELTVGGVKDYLDKQGIRVRI